MNAPESPRPGDVVAGRYRVVRLVDAAGAEALLEVEDVDGQPRWLHLLPPFGIDAADAARVAQALTIARDFTCDQVPTVIDAGLDAAGARPFVVTELLRAERLSTRLARGARPTPGEAQVVLADVAGALAAAHARGVVHGTVDEDTIFVVSDDAGVCGARLLGFGAAKVAALAPAKGMPWKPLAPTIAPEQTTREDVVTPATDVWALGVLAYALLVGRRFWRGDSDMILFREVLMDPIPPASVRAAEDGVTLPPAVDAFFARCVARSSAERFADAGEALRALPAALGIDATIDDRVCGEGDARRKILARRARFVAEQTLDLSGGPQICLSVHAPEICLSVAPRWPQDLSSFDALEAAARQEAERRALARRRALALAIGVVVLALAVAAYLLVAARRGRRERPVDTREARAPTTPIAPAGTARPRG